MARATRLLQPITEAWDWQLFGRCRDHCASQFFHPDDDMGRVSRRRREEAAKRVCDGCPVRAECAAHALQANEEYGVWGGLSEHDRVRLRELGWRDAVDEQARRADLARLRGRLAGARTGGASTDLRRHHGEMGRAGA